MPPPPHRTKQNKIHGTTMFRASACNKDRRFRFVFLLSPTSDDQIFLLRLAAGIRRQTKLECNMKLCLTKKKTPLAIMRVQKTAMSFVDTCECRKGARVFMFNKPSENSYESQWSHPKQGVGGHEPPPNDDPCSNEAAR